MKKILGKVLIATVVGCLDLGAFLMFMLEVIISAEYMCPTLAKAAGHGLDTSQANASIVWGLICLGLFSLFALLADSITADIKRYWLQKKKLAARKASHR